MNKNLAINFRTISKSPPILYPNQNNLATNIQKITDLFIFGRVLSSNTRLQFCYAICDKSSYNGALVTKFLWILRHISSAEIDKQLSLFLGPFYFFSIVHVHITYTD